jgi:radical SAM-linked protein
LNALAAESGPEPQRLRLTYARSESLRFISHQDEFRMWERTIRRSQMPLAYKQGFNPQPHMQFAAPLGVGFSGSRELMDFRLDKHFPESEIAARLSNTLPPGVRIVELQTVDLRTKPLQATLLGADYRLIVQTPALPDGQRRIQDFLARTEIWRTRQRKGREYKYNLRPVVHELSFAGPTDEGDSVAFELRVQLLEGATGRPDEVLAVLGLSNFPHLLHRDKLYFSSVPTDEAVFSSYNLACQKDVAFLEPTASQRRPENRSPIPGRGDNNSRPQVFGEKAADEFR